MIRKPGERFSENIVAIKGLGALAIELNPGASWQAPARPHPPLRPANGNSVVTKLLRNQPLSCLFICGQFSILERRMKPRNCWWALAALIALAGGLAQARDDGRYANSPLKAWFDSLHSERGPCCSDADGMTLKNVEWDTKNGHYRVFIENKWWDVPDDAVIKEPNRAGSAIVWPIYIRSMGTVMDIRIRCFMPGSMT